MKVAKELIRQCHEAGADLIKGQAYRGEDIKTGSMPQPFYHHCELEEDEYIELIDFARHLGNDMFYSIFSTGFDRLKKHQRWTKYAAAQTAAIQGKFNSDEDTEFTVMSAGRTLIDSKSVPRLRKAWVLYATDYMPKDPQLEYLEKLRSQIGGPVGISDHVIGKDNCIKAIRWHNVNCVEKHVTLLKEQMWNGTVFRDTVHGVTPRELELIANAMH